MKGVHKVYSLLVGWRKFGTGKVPSLGLGRQAFPPNPKLFFILGQGRLLQSSPKELEVTFHPAPHSFSPSASRKM